MALSNYLCPICTGLTRVISHRDNGRINYRQCKVCKAKMRTSVDVRQAFGTQIIVEKLDKHAEINAHFAEV